MLFRILIIFFLFSLPAKADQYDSRLETLFNQLLEIEDEDDSYTTFTANCC